MKPFDVEANTLGTRIANIVEVFTGLVTTHSELISSGAGSPSSIHRARASTNTPGGYRVASATEGSSESSLRAIGAFTGRSTFERFVINTPQSLCAAPKYPTPIAVLAEACAAPARSKPKPFRPSPDRDHAVFCRVESETALDGPMSETGARTRAKAEVVALISPSLPTSRPSELSA